MRELATIGAPIEHQLYEDRPTAKVVITQADLILLLDNGLLPGGGVEFEEAIEVAARRELNEELGATVAQLKPIGIVTQYRTVLQKRYIVYGYTAEIIDFSGETFPQDEREAAFTWQWVTKEAALLSVGNAIEAILTSDPEQTDDATQGRLYNLLTTRELIAALKQTEETS